ncbi:hypothetical protein [Undibacter mobilis]|uniref:Uncharacterized protein n=1 Tax=Undibacter mobilis TaxID=2292256 RepID=A0A371B747_9BRAD|nr:hypothetical protein [Undibacter mobilis]RDV03419.1 hypothetical protein DXH78_01715 [Undibacter mobilis]
MKRRLTIAMASAAVIVASAAAWADNTYYTLSAPRVIVVPQPGDDLRRTQASLRTTAPDDLDDDDAGEAAPPVRPRRVERPATPRASRAEPLPKTQSKKNEPARRKPFSASLPEPPPPPEPEPSGPKRALLSAPPPPPTASIHDGPSPLRPTPRFGQPRPPPPEPLTTFTPPPMPAPLPAPAAKPVAVAAPVADSAAPDPMTPLPGAVDDNDDHLPPPGDPRLAPPEPKD